MKKLLTILVMLLFSLPVFGITAHLPTYIITGDKEDQLKYQVNVDHELIDNTGLFMSYTLLAKWKIYDKSSPFDTYQHNPSLFWQIKNIKYIDYIRIIPWTHRSNGLSGSPSQGMDQYSYQMQISYGDIINIGINETVSGYYPTYTHRKGIPTARRVYGFFYTEFFIQTNKKQGYIGHERLAFSGEWTKRFYRYQIDFSFRLFTQYFSPHIYVQLYDGYGEFIGKHWIKTDKAIRCGLLWKI